jgi:uncharacterized protein YjiS (DUF1127 family)
MTNQIVKRYRTWRKYRETYDELMRCSNRELDDLGINRADIPTVAYEHARRKHA